MTETNGKYSDEDDRRLRAAELVLGLLSDDEAQTLRREAANDIGLRTEILHWEHRLARIADDALPVAPPQSVWAAIENQMRASAEDFAPAMRQGAASKPLWDSLAFWRGLSFASLGAAAAASIAAAVLYVQPAPVAPEQERLAAALQAGEGQASFVATYDTSSKQIVIVPASAQTEPQRVPELWLVTSDERVISLGVVEWENAHAVIIPPELVEETRAGAGLVITVEPPGGAPEGVATGPAIAQGELSPL